MNDSLVDTVSIAELREDASRVSMAYFAVALVPVITFVLILKKLRLSYWLLVAVGAALFVGGVAVARQGQNYSARARVPPEGVGWFG